MTLAMPDAERNETVIHYRERNETIARLYREGNTSRNIAKQLGLSKNIVAGVVRRYVPESHQSVKKVVYRLKGDPEPKYDNEGRLIRTLYTRLAELHRKMDAVLLVKNGMRRFRN